MCINEHGFKTYYPLKFGQEERITALIQRKKLPPKFTLNGKPVISKDILGFTEDVETTAEQTATSEGYERFRKSVMSQAWYIKAKGKRVKEPEKESQALTLIP